MRGPCSIGEGEAPRLEGGGGSRRALLADRVLQRLGGGGAALRSGRAWAEGASERGARSGGSEALPAPLPERLRAAFGLPCTTPGFSVGRTPVGAAPPSAPFSVLSRRRSAGACAVAASALCLPPHSRISLHVYRPRVSVGFVKGGPVHLGTSFFPRTVSP